MYVWTILKNNIEEEWNTLMQGYLYCDHTNKYILSRDWPEIKICYNWMASKLRQKVNSDLVLPRWVWYKIEGKSLIEVNKCFYSCTAGNFRLVLFDVNPQHVLLSDYDRWHLCMMNVHFENSAEETDKWNNYVKSLGIQQTRIFDEEYFHQVSNKQQKYILELRKEIINSWEDVFDLNNENEYCCCKNEEKTIQGVTWILRKEDICYYTDFHISQEEINKYNNYDNDNNNS